MSSLLIDSIVYKDSYGTDEMRNIFDEKQMLQRWLDIEVALAQVQADLDMIPKEATEEFEKKAKINLFDLDKMHQDYKKTGHSLMPLLFSFKEICDNNLGEYVHLGPTTQDITDTGMVIALKAAIKIIKRDLENIEESLINLASKHKLTLMVGRTHGQHALPTTFGVKVATWLREISRHIERLEDCASRLLVINLCGGVGNYSAFDGKGIIIENRIADKLGLSYSDAPWHTSRDRFAEFGSLLAMIATTCGKIGNEIYELQKTEVGEVFEPRALGQIGSSTMPHKRNPEIAEGTNGLAKIVRHLSSLLTECMLAEHERDGAAWKPEWIALPQICILSSSILSNTGFILSDLKIDEKKMLSNLHLLEGLILSEQVMIALGAKLGKLTAHAIVASVSENCHAKKIKFKEGLLENAQVNANFSEEEIDKLLDPDKYIGQSGEVVDRAIELTKKERENRNFRI